jgi:hypothetical protein
MDIKINNDVSISDNNLKIKRLLSTTVINRREIEDITAAGNMFFGIINCILIFNLPTGIKMLKGKKRVLLKKKYEKDPIIFWLYPNELSKLRSNI